MTDQPNTYVGLDLGGAQTRCVVAAEGTGGPKFHCCGSMPPVRWTDRGCRVPQMSAEAVSEAIFEAEAGGQLTLTGAVVGVGGIHVRSHLVHTAMALPHGEVRQTDIARAVRKAERGLLHPDSTALQLVPLEFIAGSRSGLQNPLGQPAKRLEAYVRVISTRTEEHESAQRLVNQASLRVEETIFSGFAAAYASLHEAEAAAGVAHLELGQSSSGLTVFCGSRLRFACGVAVGRDDLVEDIAQAFTTEEVVASSLITDFGSAASRTQSSGVYLTVPSNDPRFRNRVGRAWPRDMLDKIVSLRVVQCLELVRDELRHEGLGPSSVRSLVISGDLAALPGIEAVSEKVTGLPARIGRAERLAGLPEPLRHPGWACAAGLALYARRLAYSPPNEATAATEPAATRPEEVPA